MKELDLSTYVEEWENHMRELVRFEDNVDGSGVEGFLLDQGGGFDNGYKIAPLERCDTPEKLLEWISHLCEKAWVTTDHINQLIRLCERHTSIKRDRSC